MVVWVGNLAKPIMLLLVHASHIQQADELNGEEVT